MKKTMRLLAASILGGVLSLGGYLYLMAPYPVNEGQVDSNNPTRLVQTKYVPATNYEAEATDFTKAAEETLHAVVHVKNKALGPKNAYEYIFGGSSSQSVVGTGSGVIVSPDGYIITNNHVIDGAKEIEITLNNNKTFDAQVIGKHPNSDIALIKIDATDLPFLTFANSDNVKVGEWVLAVGNPFNLTSTVTAGIVSALARDINLSQRGSKIESFIQTDAAVNPGNSGGALVNTRGELVGINTAISSQTGSYVGYSFAVPSNIAKKVIEDLIEFGNVQTAYLGIIPVEVNSETSKTRELLETEGVLIDNFSANSRAKKSGLRVNDIIIRLDDVVISKYANLEGFLTTKRPGDEVRVTVLRDREEFTYKVKLGNQFGKEKFDKLDFSKNLIGDLKKLSNSTSEKFKIDFGVEIAKLRSPYLEDAKVQTGDIILRIGSEKVYTAQDVENLLRKNRGKDISVQVLYQRGVADYIGMRVNE